MVGTLKLQGGSESSEIPDWMHLEPTLFRRRCRYGLGDRDGARPCKATIRDREAASMNSGTYHSLALARQSTTVSLSGRNWEQNVTIGTPKRGRWVQGSHTAVHSEPLPIWVVTTGCRPSATPALLLPTRRTTAPSVVGATVQGAKHRATDERLLQVPQGRHPDQKIKKDIKVAVSSRGKTRANRAPVMV